MQVEFPLHGEEAHASDVVSGCPPGDDESSIYPSITSTKAAVAMSNTIANTTLSITMCLLLDAIKRDKKILRDYLNCFRKMRQEVKFTKNNLISSPISIPKKALSSIDNKHFFGLYALMTIKCNRQSPSWCKDMINRLTMINHFHKDTFMGFLACNRKSIYSGFKTGLHQDRSIYNRNFRHCIIGQAYYIFYLFRVTFRHGLPAKFPGYV